MTPTEAVQLLSALANERRLAVFQALRDSPVGCTPTLLNTVCALGLPQTSNCLGDLAAAGLVACGRSGRHKIYYANELKLSELVEFLSNKESSNVSGD